MTDFSLPLAASALLLFATVPPARAQCHLETFVNPAGVGGANFARAVALDGDLAAMNGWSPSGEPTVEVYERQGAADWAHLQTLTNPTPTGLVAFGRRLVALSGDTLAVVAEPSADTGTPGPGVPSDTVFLFDRQGGVFVPAGSFDLGLALGSNLAAASGIELDGDTLIVSVWDQTVELEWGAVHVFERAGGVWAPATVLLPPAGYASSGFGYTAALDGDRIYVEQWNAFAHAFVRTPSGWVYDQTVSVFTCGPWTSLHALAADGGRLFIGVDWINLDCAAEVRVYELQAPGGALTKTATIALPTIPTTLRWARLDADADRLAVSARPWTSGAPFVLGGAWIYDGGAGWDLEAELFPHWPIQNHDDRGSNMAVSGDTVLIGASGDNTLSVSAGSAAFWSVAGVGCPNLAGVPPARSLSYYESALAVGNPKHGRQELLLDAGAAHAGALYLVLGSASGTSPGVPIDGLVVPLVPDAWTTQTLTAPNATPLEATFGVLDADGQALAAIAPLGPLSTTFAGLTLHHAFVALDLVPTPVVGFASKAAPFALLP